MSADHPELNSDEVCFALVESPVNGVVMKFNPSPALVSAVICDWIAAGGSEALRMAKPDVVFAFEDHWVTMPRSILKKHDVSLGPIGAAKIVAMHVRVTKIVMDARKS